MSESAWVDTDALLVAHLETQMGVSSAYDTLKVKQVKATILRDAAQWGAWSLSGNMPTVVVESRIAAMAPGPHGNGVVNVNTEYQYAAIAVVEGTEEEVEVNAKLMFKRLVKALRLFSADVLADDGEYIRGLPKLRGGGITKATKPSSNGQWYGIAVVDFSLGRTN